MVIMKFTSRLLSALVIGVSGGALVHAAGVQDEDAAMGGTHRVDDTQQVNQGMDAPLPTSWPTDAFGRPLNSCDLPWDYVPGDGDVMQPSAAPVH